MEKRCVVAMGGGGFSMEPENPLLDDYVLSLARDRAGTRAGDPDGGARPRVCFVPTASGDAQPYITRFYRAFTARDCVPADLPLFERTVSDLESFVLAQDAVYVGGGNTANLLAVWRVHGLDRVLRRAWAEGVVLCGLSAGMNCWFGQSVTDSFGQPGLAPLHDGLALLPGSCCPHYDGEEQRRPAYRRLVGSGEFGPGWAADDGAALVFRGAELSEVVTSRETAGAYRVEQAADGDVTEKRLDSRYLGSPR